MQRTCACRSLKYARLRFIWEGYIAPNVDNRYEGNRCIWRKGQSTSLSAVWLSMQGNLTPNSTLFCRGRLLPSPTERGEREVPTLRKHKWGEVKTLLRGHNQTCGTLELFSQNQ